MPRTEGEIGEHVPLSDHQYSIACGDFEAHVASVGGALRALTYCGEYLISPFDEDELMPGMRGAILAPWPNRIRDGAYTFSGSQYQLPINEIVTGNASHGFAFMQGFTLHEQTEDSVTLRACLEPQRGYPWRIRLEVRFSVTEEGFTERITATNLSGSAAPFGMAVHPYCLAGPEKPNGVNDWLLQVPASTFLRTDDRLLPTVDASVDADGGVFDFRKARPIGNTELDTAFTGFDGNVRLTDKSGHGVEVILGDGVRWVQIYSAHKAPGSGYRASLAVEPMTCPADAFNSGRDVVILEPGDETALEWAIRRI
ncbi:MAG: aldose 1-epimerase family protein [Ancrocorticia sp.]|nr:aldose 1-epimerase family protein [Ancrocorticia sp.]